MTAETQNRPSAAQARDLRGYAGISLRGVAMGAADVVPGVSGGTIAIIGGIYEELVDSIRSVNLTAARRLFREGFASFWNSINGNFLLALGVGIGASIVSLARLLHHLLETQPVLVWSFFFGLVLASALFVGRRIALWTTGKVTLLALGAAASYLITVLSPAEANTASWFVFVSGAVAICAMILPGISGSFILVLLGMYKHVLAAVSEFNMTVLLVFAAGAATGLMAFSNLLSWLLHRYHDLTLAALIGVMIGSLNKVWPWKHVLEWRPDSNGELVPVVETNVWPQSYPALPPAELLGGSSDPQLLSALGLAACGFLTIAAFELLTRPPTRKAAEG
jgi:putative membrane protein